MKRTVVQLLALLSWLLAACAPLPFPASTPPVAKIGLIAPFEGLYRRTGYEALAAMRLAIAQAELDADISVEVLPLALNDSNRRGEAQRAAQKLLLDPAVGAVVGPLTPLSAHGAGAVLRDSSVVWLPPFALSTLPAGSATARQSDRQIAASNNVIGDGTNFDAQDGWAVGLVAAIANAARAQGAQRLVLAGDDTGWPVYTPQEWESLVQMPVSALAQDASLASAEVDSTDAVLWRNDVAAGALYLAQLRQSGVEISFWLGPSGGDPVFAEHAAAHGLQLDDGIYWATWLDADYAAWHQETGMSPSAYPVYRATQQAIATIAMGAGAANEPSALEPGEKQARDWRVHLFELRNDGTSSPLASRP